METAKRAISVNGWTIDLDSVPVREASAASPEREPLPSGGERQLRFEGTRLTAVRESDAGAAATTRCEYDRQGRLAVLDDARGGRTHYRYDEAGRLAEIVHPDGGRDRRRFDERGRWIEHRDPAGFCKRRFFDDLGRLKELRFGQGQAAVFEYDAKDRPTCVRESECTTETVYDEAGRPVRITRTIAGAAHTTEMAYDQSGRLTGLRPPGSRTWIRYRYDGLGNPETVETDCGNLRVDFERGLESSGLKLRFRNGVCAEYRTSDGQLEAIAVRSPRRQDPLLDLEYGFDERGNIVRKGREAYRYDSFDRLIEVSAGESSVQYQYNGMGDRVTETADGRRRTLTYDPSGRFLSWSGGSDEGRRSYDRAGRCTSIFKGSARLDLDYDEGGRLARVERDGKTVVEYAYNFAGQLIWRRQDGETIVHHYDPWGRLLAETDLAGNARMTYVRINLTDLARVAGPLESGQILCVHTDHLGSLRLLTDSSGQAVWRSGYTPFGLPLSEAPPGGHQFMGHRFEEETGLYCFGARFYDPESGRFITPDPYTCGPDDPRLSEGGPSATGSPRLNRWLRRPQLYNRYSLCCNNPLRFVDPTGCWSFGWILLNIVVGSIWTLPWTVFGLAVGVLNVVLQIFRPLIGLFANVSGWQGLVFDAEGCGRLNTYAIFLGGGLLGTIFQAMAPLAITMGNVVWMRESQLNNANTYAHEARHTNQYEWLGPFFHLGLPIWGVYWWDVMVNGYTNSALERDASAEAARGC